MRLVVDTRLCNGYGMCHHAAPALVDLDAQGYAMVRGEGEIGADQLEAAENAVALCPAQALLLS
jgi:ferredoxin